MSSTKGHYDFQAKTAHYKNFSVDALLWSIGDAKAAAEAMQGHDSAAACWYLDDVHTLAKELTGRR